MAYSSKRVYFTDGDPLPPNYSDLPIGHHFIVYNECSCGYNENFSTYKECLKCRAPINPATNILPEVPEFYPQDYLDFLLAADLNDVLICQAKIGKTDISCQKINPADAGLCLFCDAPLSKFGITYAQATHGDTQPYIAKTSEYYDHSRSVSEVSRSQNYQHSDRQNDHRQKFNESPRFQFEFPTWAMPLATGLAIVSILSTLFWFFVLKTTPVSVRVIAFHWVRNIATEQQNKKVFEGFASDAPPEASTGTKIKSEQRDTGKTEDVVEGKKPGKVLKVTSEPDGFKKEYVAQPPLKTTYPCGKTKNGLYKADTCPTTIPQPSKLEDVQQYKRVESLVDGMVDNVVKKPIIKEYVTIEYIRWETIAQVSSSGNDKNPKCPPTPIVFSTNQRVGNCTGVNTVLLQITNPAETAAKFPRPFLNVSDVDLVRYYKGDTYEANINNIGGISGMKLLTSGK